MNFLTSPVFNGLCKKMYTIVVKDLRGNKVTKKVEIGIICFTADSYVETDQG